MPYRQFKGLLDYLDKADAILQEVKVMETIDPSEVRRQNVKISNARLHIQEARRLIERSGQETKT